MRRSTSPCTGQSTLKMMEPSDWCAHGRAVTFLRGGSAGAVSGDEGSV